MFFIYLIYRIKKPYNKTGYKALHKLINMGEFEYNPSASKVG